jgi:ABC-2 type transport system permease protein
MDLPSAPRAFWLMARLRLLRVLNIASGLRIGKGWLGHSRQATHGKKRLRWMATGALGAFILFVFIVTAGNSLLNMQCSLPGSGPCASAQQAGQQLLAGSFHPVLLVALTMQASLLFVIAFLLPLGSKELAQADWDLEWLATLPLQRRTLLLARIAERTVVNPPGILALWPPFIVVAWYSGYRWSAPLLAAACTLPLLACAATLRTVADTGLRMRLAPSQLRNLQALASVASMPLLYLAMSLAIPTATLTLGWAIRFPVWTLWTPPGLALQALNANTGTLRLAYGLFLAVQTGLIVWLGLRVLQSMLADGVVAAGVRESGRSASAQRRSAGWMLGTPLQRRELRLLSRDRNFLVQSLLIPLIIFGSQLVLNGQVPNLGQLFRNQALVSSVAFGLGAYVLMLSAFQTIHSEGHALWMLYTYPKDIGSMLAEKAQLWSVLALLYPLAIFGVSLWCGMPADTSLFAQLMLVMAGIPIFAAIAVALGIWASDPLAQDMHARVRPTFGYAYLLLSSQYIVALNTGDWHLRLSVIVQMSLLALALWQRARHSLPYLLDPSTSPPPQVLATDGILAALIFYTLQSLITAALSQAGVSASLPAITLSFALAGALVYGLARLLYWRLRASGVPRLWHGPWRTAWYSVCGWGLLASLPAIAAGTLWFSILRAHGVLPSAPPLARMAWLVPLSIVAAPVFEEFIFRGQVFGGMRRSLSLASAMTASAALFMIVHPPLSMAPVFVLGLCTAYAAERSKSLLAPMLTHALYNACMLAFN